MSVFIIVNEWTNDDNTASSEVVGANYFTSEDAAHDSLVIIGETYDVAVGPDETSIVLEGHSPHFQFEEYYIQELTQL